MINLCTDSSIYESWRFHDIHNRTDIINIFNSIKFLIRFLNDSENISSFA